MAFSRVYKRRFKSQTWTGELSGGKVILNVQGRHLLALRGTAITAGDWRENKDRCFSWPQRMDPGA